MTELTDSEKDEVVRSVARDRIANLEKEIKAHVEYVLSGEHITVTPYTDIESAPSNHGMNVKGDGWELEINIFPKS